MESPIPQTPESGPVEALRCKDISKVFTKTRSVIRVLHNVDLTVRQGEFLIMTGQSGSGKTSLLNVIAGLEPPTTGTITIGGQNIYTLSDDERATFRATRFGIIYQQSNWVRALNVIQNVAMPLLSLGMPMARAEKKAFETLARFGLEGFARQDPLELSGGEQQRVGIARAIVHNPWLIIADEPTGSLDTHSADNVMGLLSSLNARERRTIIMVTHNQMYELYGTHQVEIRDGTVVKDTYAN